MTALSHSLALLCVCAIAFGQVMFKFTANALAAAGTPLHGGVLALAGSALLVYGLATLLWIWLLQHAALSRLYPYMALSFVLVSAAGWFFFGERLPWVQMAGLGLIVLGLLLIALA
jgi:drug/metabolite transporter (DMT)-like permease